MLKKVILIGTLSFTLSISGFYGSIYAKADKSLTLKEEKDLSNAKIETKQLEIELEQLEEPVFYGDKKSELRGTTWKRKGTIFVTTDTASANSSTWAGGHAGISYNNYYTIESFGNKGAALNGVNLWNNDWNKRYKHFKAISVNGTTAAQDAKVADKAYSYLGRKYNLNFFSINQDKSFYCSQLVWYSYKKIASIDLNDGGAVWPVDLIQSKKTYTIYSQ
ncbi:YiiX/YebB-like N1pC/P60 family cysteine hydrolase [Gottfriedia acidiceleris]|uniref:YiiX/YebB-like N1pC/P60 family cysteine hydrolase n=1 Tax=Gottfriedia acidiceleris TaxID=371036 RepID=UPI002F26051D